MSMSPYGGFNFMFSFGMIMIPIFFVLIFGIIVVVIIKGIAGWSKNNNSPILIVPAKVVAKRSSVSHHTHHHGDNMAIGGTHSSTAYYVTFEVESGSRMELQLPDREYGLLAEGDNGKLTFQGTRFKSFQREISQVL